MRSEGSGKTCTRCKANVGKLLRLEPSRIPLCLECFIKALLEQDKENGSV